MESMGASEALAKSSGKKSHSKIFGASVSRRKAINASDTLLECTLSSCKAYSVILGPFALVFAEPR